MGKAYANKKVKNEKPEGDFYPTPKSLIWVMEDIIKDEFDKKKTIFEPCSGNGAISSEIRKLDFLVEENDLYKGGFDYVKTPCNYTQIITNPPFSLWDKFIEKAKQETEKLMSIGRLNYFGTADRLNKGIWNNLKAVYCFNRYVDYRTLEREDGLFNVGAMATAWFIWEKNYKESPSLHFLNVQSFAKLGNYKEGV
jgi:hypothetical protein